jgi:hypothetical protein
MGTMPHERREADSVADRLRDSQSGAEPERPDAQPWPQPIQAGNWTDDNGTEWHIRGGRAQLPDRVLRRLLKRTDVRVLHAYGPRPTEVAGSEREALLERVERYFAGTAAPQSQFWLAEFRDERRHVLLVIQEAC